MTASEINESLNLPKQTVHRLCTTLEENGFIARLGNSKKYQVARRLRELGSGLIHSSRDHIARHQILNDLAAKVGETVNYVAPEDGGMRYLDRVETDWAFRIQLPIGTNVPFHCTASGKCYLASLDADQRSRMLNAIQFEPRTANTHMNAKSLTRELDQIAEQGYSLDKEELFDGMVALAVPVLDTNGRFFAAVAFHGPTQRLSEKTLVSHLKTMQDGARQLADLM